MSVRSESYATTTNQQSGGEIKSPSMTELCINLVKEFVQGSITRNKAMHEITEVFKESSTHDEVTPDQVQSAITSFIAMLDQAQFA